MLFNIIIHFFYVTIICSSLDLLNSNSHKEDATVFVFLLWWQHQYNHYNGNAMTFPPTSFTTNNNWTKKKKLYLLFNQNNNNKSSITIVVETTASITTTTTFLQLLPGETAWIREETHSIYNLDILLHSTKNKSTMMSSTDLPLTPTMIHDNCEGWLKVFHNNTTAIEPMMQYADRSTTWHNSNHVSWWALQHHHGLCMSLQSVVNMNKLFCAERKLMHIFATMAWARDFILILHFFCYVQFLLQRS